MITSAGLVLAATFGALAVLPLVLLSELAFLVGFGVLLDTFVVRSLLVPAAVRLIGDKVWWPSRLAQRAAGAQLSVADDARTRRRGTVDCTVALAQRPVRIRPARPRPRRTPRPRRPAAPACSPDRRPAGRSRGSGRRRTPGAARPAPPPPARSAMWPSQSREKE